MNGIVRALEQQGLAICHQLHALVVILGVQILECLTRQHGGGRDVVFDLDLVGRMKVGPELINAPRSVGIVTHPEIVPDQLLVFELQLVAQVAIDAVDTEMLAPVVAPLRLIVALDGNQKLAHRG